MEINGSESFDLEITDKGRAGLFVADDGSSAEIDSRNLVFCNNAEGDLAAETAKLEQLQTLQT